MTVKTDTQRARATPIHDIWERLGLPAVKDGAKTCNLFRGEKNPSLQVGGEKNVAHDYATNETMDGIDLVQRARKCTFPEAVEWINGKRAAKRPPLPPPPPTTAEKTSQIDFDALPPAENASEAVNLLTTDYGISPEIIPTDWRIHDGGIVYTGIVADEKTLARKWKGLTRDAKGKRPCKFLEGSGQAALFLRPPEAATAESVMVETGGEEKALAAFQAGYWALSPLSGESGLSDAWVRLVAKEWPGRIIMANDNDDGGEQGNNKAAVLEQAGFNPDLIGVVTWPDGTPKGGDLNDTLKTMGVDGVRDLLAAARPWQSTFPRVLSAVDFLAAPRPPLEYHISGILPYGGKLTFSATSKFGKSMWAIQAGMAMAAGGCEWLGWGFGRPARVLYLQAEIMDALVEARLGAILRDMPAGIDRQRAGRNFLIQEICKQRPNLYTLEGRKVAETLIARHKPQVLILDPLAAICPGMEENTTESMSLVLDYFSDLTLRFECAVVLIHHHGKSGVSRGSSVFEAWPESDLQASFLLEGKTVNREIATVDMRLRCIHNSGPVYWRTPAEGNLWFEAMAEGWKPPKQRGRTPVADVVHAVTVLKAEGKLSYGELSGHIQALTGCSKSTAASVISEARKGGVIDNPNGLYRIAKPLQQ